MSILNDKQIRSLCMKPTHRIGPHVGEHYLSEYDGVFYGTATGETLNEREMRLYQNGTLSEPTERALQAWERKRMIYPFEPGQVREIDDQKIVSYGTSSMGYDVRLSNKFKIFTNIHGDVIDPLNMSDTMYVDHEGDFVIIPPNSYVLGHTVETFNIPRDVLTVCVGKSTYARCAAICNVTPIEPGFKGTVVIEVANSTPLPLKIYANQGIAQFLFFKGEPCETSYDDRGGKYQNQTGVQTALL